MNNPIVFKHTEDGKWRSRFNGRTFKFLEGTHEPGIDGGPPPTTPSGAFRMIPKPLRFDGDPAEKREDPPAQSEAPEPKPQPEAQTEPQTTQDPQPAQTQPSQPPQMETPQTASEPANTGFPTYCEDALRGASGISDGAGVEPEAEQQPNPFGETPAQTKKKKQEIPLIEMLVDSMFGMGEQLGGPKAPKSATMGAFSIESLRDNMVESAKEAFPGADVEMGPKTTFALCMAGYLGLCMSEQRFRENTTPWYLHFRGRIAGWWARVKYGRQKRKEEKAAKRKEPETKPEPEQKAEDAQG